MKYLFIALLLGTSLVLNAQRKQQAENIFIITVDGLRWQEIFKGADHALLANTNYVEDTALMRALYFDTTAENARQKLMPFFWNIIAAKGQLYGNRLYNNTVDVNNIYKISYAGYNEILTGHPDKRFIPNTKKNNRNINVLEYLNSQQSYQGKVVAFTSWDVFPYILNETRSGFAVNSGYEDLPEDDGDNVMINSVQDSIAHKTNTRYDMLTWMAAKEYIKKHHPRVMMLGLGETDKFAHECKYDNYLQQINNVDKMIGELWYSIQTDPFYKNNTTFIITTDHGRGRKSTSWYKHHLFVKGSGEAWMALLGSGISPKGEMKTTQEIYLKQIAATVALLLGEEFKPGHAIGSAINLPAGNNTSASSTIAAIHAER